MVFQGVELLRSKFKRSTWKSCLSVYNFKVNIEESWELISGQHKLGTKTSVFYINLTLPNKVTLKL